MQLQKGRRPLSLAVGIPRWRSLPQPWAIIRSRRVKVLITDERVAVDGTSDRYPTTGVMPAGNRVAGELPSRRRDPSEGGETHERSIRTGCSHAVHDGAPEVVATRGPTGNSRKATPVNTTPFPLCILPRLTTSDGVAERTFTFDEISGLFWSPESGTDGVPPLLRGHGAACTCTLQVSPRRPAGLWRATGRVTAPAPGSRSPRSTRPGTATSSGPIRISCRSTP